jgi:ABC-type transport system involved in multi-copper enzyme maturation permease subunit
MYVPGLGGNRVVGSFAAEMLKLRKRRSTWGIGALLVLSMAVGHNLAYTEWLASLESGAPERVAVNQWWLRPENFAPLVVDTVAFLGGPIALILGALVGGSEYAWNTLKSILPRRAGRSGVLKGKILGLAASLLMAVPAIFAEGYALSLLTGGAVGAPVGTPPAWGLVTAIAAVWLILAAWGTVGLALGVLSQGTTFAVGMGLVYALAIEFAVRGTVSGDDGIMAGVRDSLLGSNASALARSFVPDGIAGDVARIGPVRAVLALMLYAVGSSLVAWAVFRRRDVH